MKHLYLLVLLLVLVLLLALSTQAQTTDPARQKLDLIFAPLDKSQVPTGRLAEAAVPLAPARDGRGTQPGGAAGRGLPVC